MVFKYQVSSEYPQSYLKQFQLTYSSKLVEINGEKVHLVIMMTPKSFKFEMYTFPDNEVGIAWFERIFTFLVDYSTGHWKESSDVKN